MSVMPSEMSWIPLAAAGVQAGGSLLGGFIGAGAQAATNAQQFQQAEMLFNQQQASIPAAQIQSEQNAWAMRRSAYQETMKDMKDAGLNPILAANLGATGAPGMPVSMASGSAPGMVSPGSAMAAGITSAANAARTYSDMKVALQAADTAASQEKLNQATEALTQKQQEKTDQDTRVGKATERLTDAAALTKVSEAAANYAAANSANAMARVNTRVAEDTERFGDSPISKAVGGLLRMLSTATGVPSSARTVPAQPAWSGSVNGGPTKPFSAPLIEFKRKEW